MQYLFSRGHQRIAAIAWPEDSRVGNERMRGYFESMQDGWIEDPSAHGSSVARVPLNLDVRQPARLLKLPACMIAPPRS